MKRRNFENEFLTRLAPVWLGCRLNAMGGVARLAGSIPVKDFKTLGWAFRGCIDYADEMTLLCQSVREA